MTESWTNKGLWILSKADDAYPSRFRERLRQLAPPLIFGAGDPELLGAGGLAVVGSREIDEERAEFARCVGRLCAQQQIPVISGGARGVDREVMLTALEEEGQAVGVLAGDLARSSLLKPYREAICQGQLTLVSPYDPAAGFSVGNAMGRNKLIYALADWALVVSATSEQGGTWAGATENLKAKWAPLFVRSDDPSPGEQALMEKGAFPLSREDLRYQKDVREWLDQQAHEARIEATNEPPEVPPGARQLSLPE